ncbi:class B sortase [Candidatus Saccharibacteria bacterium]|nr:class B sortase [Candidatus Saccharibacteria bacterium]
MKQKKLISALVLIFSLAVVIFSGYKILKYNFESRKTNEKIEELTSLGNPEEIPDEQGSEPERSADENSENFRENLYWKYLNTPLLSVNLEGLKAENADTVGWLQVLGTNINYPFVQTSDNRFYLYHSFDKSYNSAGWVFLDYRNSKNLSDKNNIIYAHGRTDKTMFGSLKNLLTSSWINSPENYLLRTKTENSSAVWEIFSVYVIPTTSDYIATTFRSDSEFEEFLNLIKSRSEHDFSTELSKDDKILTLSTCFDEEKKVVIHAKLLKSAEI